MLVPVTALYAGILAIFALGLSFHAGMSRGKVGASILYGDPLNMELAQRVRVHLNFLEYVPMLLIVPILDNIGYASDAALYRYDDYYVFERERGPYGPLHILSSYFNCLLFLNEIWVYDLLGYQRDFAGPRCFSNDPYWFLSYLMPYLALLAVACKVPGRTKYAILAAMSLVIGPPILLLAPIFFCGALAYLIHKRY